MSHDHSTILSSDEYSFDTTNLRGREESLSVVDMLKGFQADMSKQLSVVASKLDSINSRINSLESRQNQIEEEMHTCLSESSSNSTSSGSSGSKRQRLTPIAMQVSCCQRMFNVFFM